LYWKSYPGRTQRYALSCCDYFRRSGHHSHASNATVYAQSLTAIHTDGQCASRMRALPMRLQNRRIGRSLHLSQSDQLGDIRDIFSWMSLSISCCRVCTTSRYQRGSIKPLARTSSSTNIELFGVPPGNGIRFQGASSYDRT
jgi:hypothetical protein